MGGPYSGRLRLDLRHEPCHVQCTMLCPTKVAERFVFWSRFIAGCRRAVLCQPCDPLMDVTMDTTTSEDQNLYQSASAIQKWTVHSKQCRKDYCLVSMLNYLCAF